MWEWNSRSSVYTWETRSSPTQGKYRWQSWWTGICAPQHLHLIEVMKVWYTMPVHGEGAELGSQIGVLVCDNVLCYWDMWYRFFCIFSIRLKIYTKMGLWNTLSPAWSSGVTGSRSQNGQHWVHRKVMDHSSIAITCKHPTLRRSKIAGMDKVYKQTNRQTDRPTNLKL